jgi:hypothetical protein
MQKVAPAPKSITRPEDAEICLDLLGKGIANLHDRSLSKFQMMFANLRTKVYASNHGFDISAPLPQPTDDLMFAGGEDIIRDEGATEIVSNADMNMMLLSSEGLEGYLSQMSTIFDNEMFDIDDTLTAWYGSVLNDIGDAENM